MRWWPLLATVACGAPAVQTAPDPAVSAPRAPSTDDAIYFVLVDRFANGDTANDGSIDPADPQAWHGGDLQGVLDHLDHIEAMGFKTVWLSPIHNGREAKFHEWGAYHGYWVHDLETVHPRFGTPATLHALSTALEEREMRLVVDMVYNHTGFDAPRRDTHPHWFHDAPGIENWDDPVEVVTHQVHGLPDLAQEEPEVHAYLRDQTLDWVKTYGIDGLRIDAVRHMPQPFFATLHAELEQELGAPMQTLAEVFEGDPAKLVGMWREGGYGSAFNFPLHYALIDAHCKGTHPGRVPSTLDAEAQLSPPGTWVNFLDNHDVGRVASACAGSESALKSALTSLLLMPGTPMVTYGTESALEGAEEPANRADMRFDDTPLASLITDVLALRAAHPTLTAGERRTLHLDAQSWVDLRSTPSEAVAVASNFGDTPVTLALPWTEGDLPLGGAQWKDGALVLAPLTTTVIIGTPLAASAAAETTLRFVRPAGPEGAVPRLVGGNSTIGNWDPKQAPAWVDEELALTVPTYSTLDYKLVWEFPDGTFTWESGPNRYTLADPAASQPIALVLTDRTKE
ncbi:MAG: DUF3459 domain-containing protein [Proteobacteria bacterium]|nr:DUF3459 domain-containing protein [Pseudomonadota bacterium]